MPPLSPINAGFVTSGPELRRSQRYQTKLRAVVVNSFQQQASATVIDISNQGLRLEGSEQLVSVLFPKPFPSQQQEPLQNKAIESGTSFQVKLALPQPTSSNAEGWVELQCSSIYVLRIKRGLFQVGVCYQQIKAKEGAKLEAFILSLQR